MATQTISGLSSGIDTSTIVEQLMQLERQPQTRLRNQLSVSDARKQVLQDIQTRLRNLQLAAQDLKSPALWANKQTTEVSDSTKLAASLSGAAGTGSYQVTISQLARGSQRWFTYAPPAADDTITFSGGHTTTIPAGSDIDAAAAAVNADSAAPVYASAVTDAQTGVKYLVFSSRTTGQTASAFTASAGALTEDTGRAVGGLDAQYSVDGGLPKSSPTNTVTDAVPGLSVTLKAVTTVSGPVTVNVGAPGPDKEAISAKMKAFVEQYNSTLEFVRSKLDEKRVPNAATAADRAKGLLKGDSMLEGVLSQLRRTVSATFATGGSTALDEMSEIGVSTGSASAGGLNKDAIMGKLTFDAAKFATALTNDALSVKGLMSGTSGFGQAIDSLLAPTLQAGGTMASRLTSEDSTKKRISDQIARMDVLLLKKESTLKTQFAAMEKALQSSQAQGQWLSGQLASLQRS